MKKDEYRIIAVDDGSSDGSGRILQRLMADDIIIAQHKTNLSIGAVFLTGLNISLRCSSDNSDIAILMECDQTNDPDLLKALIDEIDSKGKDIAIASRFIGTGAYLNFPFVRRLYSICANRILKWFFSIPSVTDYTIFYRAYRMGILKELSNFFGLNSFIQCRNFVSNSELLIKASLFTNKISEVPFRYDYGNKRGKSKLRPLSNILEYIYFIYYMRKVIQLKRQGKCQIMNM